jgi:C_GCAxxG_C_C family probable redox protein
MVPSEDYMSNRKPEEIASERFRGGFNCAESVLLALSEVQGVESPLIPRMATGLGAGLAQNCEVCGALIGATLALGIRYGREDGKDQETKQALYAKVQALVARFREQFGSSNCRELTGCDLSKPEEVARFKEENIHWTVCPKMVEFAAAEAHKLLEE